MSVHLNTDEVARLDEIRSAKVSRSAFMRGLLRSAGPQDDAPTHDEAVRLLSEADRFEAFLRMLGHRLEPFQRLIVEELFSERRETLVLIPRGNGKSTLLAAVGLWSLLRKPDAQIVWWRWRWRLSGRPRSSRPRRASTNRGGWSSHEPVVGQDRRERGARAAG